MNAARLSFASNESPTRIMASAQELRRSRRNLADELELTPDAERRELALIYQAKGLAAAFTAGADHLLGVSVS